MLGIEVSERTGSRLLDRVARPRPQTWKPFLSNHLAAAASMDFFTVPTLTGRILFVVVVLSHHRRRIVHVNVTDHPTATWAAQQLIDAFPDDTAPHWLHIIAAERISDWRRTRRTTDLRLPPEPSPQSPKSVVSITATTGARRKKPSCSSCEVFGVA